MCIYNYCICYVIRFTVTKLQNTIHVDIEIHQMWVIVDVRIFLNHICVFVIFIESKAMVHYP
jgi:hypothetical protein